MNLFFVLLLLHMCKDEGEQRVTMQKNPNGLGLKLSTGPPPVIVKYVDPGKYFYVSA